MLSAAVLITAQGRDDSLSRCLEPLIRQADDLRGEGLCSFDYYIGSPSGGPGAGEFLPERFPEVKIVRWDGADGWCDSMRHVWKSASEAAEYDFFLWVDPEIELADGALGTIMETSALLRNKAVVAGSVCSGDGTLVGGGRTSNGRLISPDVSVPVPCASFDGALVLVPGTAYEALGSIDGLFHDGGGDFDYGIRAGRKGILRVIAPGTIALRRHPALPRSLTGRERFVLDRRSRGVFYAALHPVLDFAVRLLRRR